MPQFGHYLDINLDINLDIIWTLIWTLFGHYLDIIWTLFGQYLDIDLDIIWALFGHVWSLCWEGVWSLEECTKLFSHLLVQCWFYFKLEDLPLTDHKSNFQICLSHWSKARSGGSACAKKNLDTPPICGLKSPISKQVCFQNQMNVNFPSFHLHKIGNEICMCIKTSLSK